MKAWRIFVMGAVCFLVLGVALSLIGDKGFFLKWLSGHRHPILDYFFYYITLVGEPHGFVIIGLILWLKSWRRMLTIPLVGGIVMLVSYMLKNIFEFERPGVYLHRIGWDGPMNVLDYYIHMGYSSFPSGHAMAAWALLTLTAALCRKTWVSVLCLFLAVLVSLSRVYLMVHFLRDVVAGAAVGFILGYGVYCLYKIWMKKPGPDQNLDSLKAE
jgi:membrane-associated phospholipid phosphatase